jgi:hypothetical protein
MSDTRRDQLEALCTAMEAFCRGSVLSVRPGLTQAEARWVWGWLLTTLAGNMWIAAQEEVKRG